MAFVNTQPAAIAAAAQQLEGIGNSFAAESSGAATSTTDLIPAASDEVSTLQAGVFSTYGKLYQTVSAQAQAIHQQFVNLMNQSSGSYLETEAANQAGAAASSLASAGSSAASTAATDPVESLAGWINGVTTTLSSSPLNSNLANLGNIQVGNYASAASDLFGMFGGGLLTAMSGPATAGADIGGLGTALAGNVVPAPGIGGGAVGGAPILASAGGGSSIGALSVPPSWAGGAGISLTGAPATLASQSFTAGAPTTGGMTNGIAGMPAVANGGRGGSSFGAPRYGVKPKVMPALPKPTLT